MLTRHPLHDATSPVAGEELADQPLRRDAGITLIELLVTMVLMGVVGSMCITFFVAASKTTGRTGSETLMAARARVAMSSMTQLLQLADSPTIPGRFADRIETISPTQITFYTNANENRAGSAERTAPLKVQLAFTPVTQTTPAQLVQTTWQPLSPTGVGDVNYPQAATSTLILLGDDGTQLGTGGGFTYCTGDTPTAAGCTATTDPSKVVTVGVTLVVTGSNRSTQTFTSTTALIGSIS